MKIKHLGILLFLLFLLTSFQQQQRVCIEVIKTIDDRYFILWSDSTYEKSDKATYDVHKMVKVTLKESSTKSTSTNYSLFNSNTKNTTTSKTRSTTSAKTRSTTSKSSICGARTKKGTPCQRLVVGGGYCYQHR